MERSVSRFWQRVSDYSNDETRDPFSHSSSYHRHFQGYAEQRVPKKSGVGTRIERIYVADYYRYAETDLTWRFKKLVYVFLFAMAASAVVIADSRPLARPMNPPAASSATTPSASDAAGVLLPARSKG